MRRFLYPVLALLLLAGACADEEPAAVPTTVAAPATTVESTTAPTTTVPPPTTATPATTTTPTTTAALSSEFPVTVSSDAGEVTIETMPQRIASLSATHVEMLYAVGAGDQVIAGDLFSNYPPEAAAIELIDSFNLSVESVIALDPDLVILSFDPVDAVAAFDAVGIPTLLLGTAQSVEAAYEQMVTVGKASGHTDAARALVDDIDAALDTIVASAGDDVRGMTYYHETDPFSFYTPNSSSFIGKLYGLLGMENIADAAPDEFGSGFPQLSPEFIVAADPQLIVLGAGGDDPAALAERPGWDTMTAVQNGNIAVVDSDVASRWGPRIVDLLNAIADAATSAS